MIEGQVVYEQWLEAQHLRDMAVRDVLADENARLIAENDRLRREVVILTGRWTKPTL